MAGKEILRKIAFAVDTYGKIDVLFNNAAILMPKSLEEGTEEKWDRLCVNLKGVIFCTKYAMPELRKTKGRIVNMASWGMASVRNRNGREVVHKKFRMLCKRNHSM
jgi:NAD(P)-dependent dehydrogenase (short-subunit alcohol dehydrogenase family)